MEIKLTLGFGFVTLLVLLVVLLFVYWLLLRPVLRKVPQLSGFYAHADAVEQGWFGRFKGWRTIIFARLQAVGAALLAAIAGLYQFAQPLFQEHAAELQQIVSAAWWPWIVVGVLALGAFIGERLRYDTDGPVPGHGGSVAPPASGG